LSSEIGLIGGTFGIVAVGRYRILLFIQSGHRLAQTAHKRVLKDVRL
jgi:hypothetical protein